MGQVVLLSLTAALNPTLLAASTVMLLLERPARLMLGYLLGAYLTSITLGLVIVYSLKHSGAVSTTQNTVSPGVDLALGGLALAGAFVLGTGRDQRLAEHRRERKADKPPKGPPKWQRALSKGSPRVTFLIGALLTLPGASYIAGLGKIEKLGYSTAETVLVVVGFNLVMLALLEVPLLCYAFAPDWTPGAIDRAKVWISRRWHKFAFRALLLLGAALVIKGIVELVS